MRVATADPLVTFLTLECTWTQARVLFHILRPDNCPTAILVASLERQPP